MLFCRWCRFRRFTRDCGTVMAWPTICPFRCAAQCATECGSCEMQQRANPGAPAAKDGTGHGQDRRQDRPPAGGRRARPTMSAPSLPAAELTIGIVGTHDLVEKIMLSGPLAGPAGPADQAVPARRLIAAAYRDEQEAADRVTRLGPGIDVCLFASKVPYL